MTAKVRLVLAWTAGMTLFDSAAYACSLLPISFDPFPTLYPVIIAITASGIFGFRWLKNYPSSSKDKKIRPAIALTAIAPLSLIMGLIVYLLWPGYGPKVGCPEEWKLTRNCKCVSADGEIKPTESMGVTINPARRLKDLSKGWE
ncbi:MAG: hypothetical protein PSY14_06665 [bacterium]|nr:hypothetical protein [bacterium]